MKYIRSPLLLAVFSALVSVALSACVTPVDDTGSDTTDRSGAKDKTSGESASDGGVKTSPDEDSDGGHDRTDDSDATGSGPDSADASSGDSNSESDAGGETSDAGDETSSDTATDSPNTEAPGDVDGGNEGAPGDRTTYGKEVVEQRVGNETVVWSDDLEGSLGDWGVEGGVWAKGVPEFADGPQALSGEQVFGTNLEGNTDINQDARLVSPEFLIDGDENPRFRFAYWHSLGLESKGVVQISVDGGDWEDLDAPMVGNSGGWGQRVVPLRDYDGKRVRIGIRMTTGRFSQNNAPGIYVDDASFATGEMEFNSPDDLESGLGNWSAEGGVWAWGEPDFANGPEPLSGKKVFGTNLRGNNDANQDARLVSPEFLVDGDENPRFRFAYWHSLGLESKGVVQISVDGDDWEDLDAPMVGNSGGWGQRVVPLRDYDGKRVRIGIRMTTGRFPQNNAPGIYVDDASFATGEMEFNSPDDLESGLGNWSAEGGVWAWGEPDFANGPEPLSGKKVFGTNLRGNNDANQDARLVSPEFLIDGDGNPRFRFAYWHSLGLESKGVVQISVDGDDWEDLDAPMVGNSGGWGQRVVPLRDYEGKRVRIGVRMTTGRFPQNNAPGIYVDDASFATN